MPMLRAHRLLATGLVTSLLWVSLLIAQEPVAPARQPKPAKAEKKAKPDADAPPRWVWEHPQTPAGTQFKTFYSGAIRAEVSYLLWLPPGYNDRGNERKTYPVVYFLHGGGGNYQHIPEFFLPQAEEAIKAGALPPFLGIVVNGLPSSFYVDAPGTPVETVIMRDLVPHVDVSYRSNGRRLIEGFSMGGRGCTYLGFKYPETFHGVADFSGAIHDWSFFRTMNVVAGRFNGEEAFNEAWVFNVAKQNAAKIREHMPAGVLIVVGDADTGRGNTCEWNRKLHAHLDELKIPNELVVVPGVKHSYELLAREGTVRQAHLKYYAAVFNAPWAQGETKATKQ